MNKCCADMFYNCKGGTKRYEIYSNEKDSSYPRRYWGVADYCESCYQDETKRGFNLTETNSTRELVTL